jgi:hypothetical protein
LRGDAVNREFAIFGDGATTETAVAIVFWPENRRRLSQSDPIHLFQIQWLILDDTVLVDNFAKESLRFSII